MVAACDGNDNREAGASEGVVAGMGMWRVGNITSWLDAETPTCQSSRYRDRTYVFNGVNAVYN